MSVYVAEYLIGALIPVATVVIVRLPGWRRHTVRFSAHLACVASVIALAAYLLTWDGYAAGTGTTAVAGLYLWWWRTHLPAKRGAA